MVRSSGQALPGTTLGEMHLQDNELQHHWLNEFHGSWLTALFVKGWLQESEFHQKVAFMLKAEGSHHCSSLSCVAKVRCRPGAFHLSFHILVAPDGAHLTAQLPSFVGVGTSRAGCACAFAHFTLAAPGLANST